VERNVLGGRLCEKQGRRPVQRNMQALFKGWQLHQVDGSPYPPGDKTENVTLHHLRDTRTKPNCRQLTDRCEGERL
jgi:hypothetical protein